MLQYAAFLLVIILLVKPLGAYMARVFTGERAWLDFLLRPIERMIYRVTKVDANTEMNWREYASAFVLFGAVGTFALFLILKLQHLLPWYDAAFLATPMTTDLAMNTAVSFATTTTWQAYAGETTMSYFSQVVGLTVQNFLAGAAGLAVGIAFIRGLARENTEHLGNFWVDLVRGLLWVLLPLSIIGSLLLVAQGVPANFSPYTTLTTVEGLTQIIPQGPVAVLEFIKNLGTNGGGFFNTNGAHPFENPTPLTNFIEMLAIAVLPAALTHTFGRMVNRPRQGWVLFWVMTFLFTAGLLLFHTFEGRGIPAVRSMLSESAMTVPNMEGKETRFGLGATALTAITTSNGATGSYNAMHDSFTPMGGFIPLSNMLLGEIIYGGLGTGLYSIILVALIGLFLAGLMIGRKPEYLGKEIGISEMKLIMLYTLAAPFAILTLTAVALSSSVGLAGLTTNVGAHGLTEILYAYTTAVANNGQNFAGLSANSFFYNLTLTIAMMIGRFGLAIPALALAGHFARQGRRPVTMGTLPTDSFAFGVLLVGTALIVGGLSYFPTLALGPILEHLQMHG